MSLSDTIRVPQGDTQILPFSVEDGGGSVDLGGATIEWALYDGDNKVLSLSDSGVAIQNRDDPNGTFEVEIGAGATDTVTPGNYNEQIRVIDKSGKQSTFSGEVRLQPANA